MTLGEIKSANSFTLSYLWGMTGEQKDYTNPMVELSARYESFPESILSEIKYRVQSGEVPELHDVFRLLAVDLKNEDAWSFYTSLTGEKPLKVKMPFSKKVRRQYMEFAIAYAGDSPNARDLADQFVVRHPRESVTALIRVIFLKDHKLPAR